MLRTIMHRAPRVSGVLALFCAWGFVLSAAGCSPAAGGTTAPAATPFTLTSSAFQEGGALPVVHTCDGAGNSPPLTWTGAPTGTVQFALLMTTLANDGMRWNWVLHGIPASATSLSVGTSGVGTPGLTSDGPLLKYYPPCSQGPGAKTYTFTLYALSAVPALGVPSAQVTGALVTNAIRAITISSASVNVMYER